jgi:hypothetical protein
MPARIFFSIRRDDKTKKRALGVAAKRRVSLPRSRGMGKVERQPLDALKSFSPVSVVPSG